MKKKANRTRSNEKELTHGWGFFIDQIMDDMIAEEKRFEKDTRELKRMLTRCFLEEQLRKDARGVRLLGCLKTATPGHEKEALELKEERPVLTANLPARARSAGNYVTMLKEEMS
jgi:hypothetical protein